MEKGPSYQMRGVAVEGSRNPDMTSKNAAGGLDVCVGVVRGKREEFLITQ